MNNNIWLITKREFKTQVKKKSFLIMTILAPLLMVGLIVIITFIFKVNETQKKIGIIDESGLFTTSFKSNQSYIYNFYKPHEKIALEDSILNNKYLDGLLIIPKPTDSSYQSIISGVQFMVNNNIGIGSQSEVNSILNKRIQELRLEKSNISKDEFKELSPDVKMQIINLNAGGSEENSSVKMVLSYVLLYIIFTFILIYGMRVMRSVLEEKNNRVIEIIISSVKPFDLMLGKIFGTTLVAIVQFLVWISMALILIFILNLFLISPDEMPKMNQMPNTQNMENMVEWQKDSQMIVQTLLNLNIPLIIFIFIFYWTGGYLLFSSFFAAIGASVDNETETSQFTPVVMIPLVIGMYSSFSIAENPDGPVAFWASMIPITSPVAMVARSPYGVPWWELFLSMTLLVLAIIGMVLLAAKIYRIGILMYGKKTNFKELWKWIRTNP